MNTPIYTYLDTIVFNFFPTITLNKGAMRLAHEQHKYSSNQKKKIYLSKYSAYTTGSGKICSKNSSPSSPFDFKYSQRVRQYKASSGVNVSTGINFLHLEENKRALSLHSVEKLNKNGNKM